MGLEIAQKLNNHFVKQDFKKDREGKFQRELKL